MSACSSADEPVPIAAPELIALHVEDGVTEEVATCAISILIDDNDPESLRPGAERSPVVALTVEETFNACGVANGLLTESDEEPVELAFSNEPQVYGDDRALDELWDFCEAGDGEACDSLWEDAPVGSVYEQFGVTCGDRLDLLNCAEELIIDPGLLNADGSLIDSALDSAEGDETEDGDDTDGGESNDGQSSDGD